jgi:hypothetical protein
MNAGPGKTKRATPISRTVAPTTETITRLTTLIFSRSQTLTRRFVHEEDRLFTARATPHYYNIVACNESGSVLSANRSAFYRHA